VQRIGRATLAALVVGGLTSAGAGIAFADGHGAAATGGAGSLFEQNTAQNSRQNNNCATTQGLGDLLGTQVEGRCASGDASFNEDAKVLGGGAHAVGGSANGTAFQQNTAQKGRQNNNCDNSNVGSLLLSGRMDDRCANSDGSVNSHTAVLGGGAEAVGGPGRLNVVHQNTAQEGRQNNNCNNPNSSTLELTGAKAEGRCANGDESFSKHALVKGGGAQASGGEAFLGVQQNTAQEGRQNNNCNNPNDSSVALTGTRAEGGCVNKDGSASLKTKVLGGGAQANGGSTSGLGNDVFQQNTAQEGRQNNNCNNPNASAIALTGTRAEGRCVNEDGSFSKHALVKGGGAQANGGSAVAGDLTQQNTAQSGRQNNNCNNPNGSTIELTGSQVDSSCVTSDHSASVGTTEISDGAEADGGSSLMNLFQQNTAQEGRQNNNCGNPNRLPLTASGSRTRTQCLAVDHSKNIHSVHR
jgi:hypothetical protein